MHRAPVSGRVRMFAGEEERRGDRPAQRGGGFDSTDGNPGVSSPGIWVGLPVECVEAQQTRGELGLLSERRACAWSSAGAKARRLRADGPPVQPVSVG